MAFNIDAFQIQPMKFGMVVSDQISKEPVKLWLLWAVKRRAAAPPLSSEVMSCQWNKNLRRAWRETNSAYGTMHPIRRRKGNRLDDRRLCRIALHFPLSFLLPPSVCGRRRREPQTVSASQHGYMLPPPRRSCSHGCRKNEEFILPCKFAVKFQ